MRICFSMASCHFNLHARSFSIQKCILYSMLTRRAESNIKLLLFMVHLNNYYYYVWRSLANVQSIRVQKEMIRHTLEQKCWSTRDDNSYFQFKKSCWMLWLLSENYSSETLSIRRYNYLKIQIPRILFFELCFVVHCSHLRLIGLRSFLVQSK